jgi:hypothetical protein
MKYAVVIGSDAYKDWFSHSEGNVYEYVDSIVIT